MSRLKEKIRKNIIKVTTCSLALSLAIGSVQGLGTYAWFTDTKDVESNLVISTGNVDVAILDRIGNLSSGFKYIMTSYANSSRTIRISNQGTLKQNIKIKVSFISGDVSKNIDYKLIDTNGNNIIDTNFRKLYENGTIIVELPDTLNPGDEMTFKGEVYVDALIFGTREFDFKFEVIATQVGDTNNGGFSDSYTHTNKVLVNTLGKVLNEQEAVESPKEKVEEPSESEVVQSPKEEVEEPSEPEVIEPPKEKVEEPSESEVIEQPKEEVEESSELEIIEPPKEEIEEPSESDVVVSNQTDIIAQKKEEDVE